MKIKLTSVSTPDTFPPLNAFFTKLEDFLNVHLAEKPFGDLDSFIFVLISVDDNGEQNALHAKKHNASGTFPDYYTKERLKFCSVAIPFEATNVLALSPDKLREELCDQIINQLASTKVKVPKKFHFNSFVDEARLALELYKRRDI